MVIFHHTLQHENIISMTGEAEWCGMAGARMQHMSGWRGQASMCTHVFTTLVCEEVMAWSKVICSQWRIKSNWESPREAHWPPWRPEKEGRECESAPSSHFPLTADRTEPRNLETQDPSSRRHPPLAPLPPPPRALFTHRAGHEGGKGRRAAVERPASLL